MAWIEFDIPALIALKEDLESTIDFIKDELPDVNWNSIPQAIYYFSHEHNIMLHGTSISSLKEVLENWESDPETLEYSYNPDEAKEILVGLIELKKLQYTVRNYINNILKHNQGGVYPLRLVNGEWRMQNKQPRSYHDQINSCIISQSDNI
jgi:hypothetical protein